METKFEKAKALLLDGELRKALQVAKAFTRHFSRSEQRTIQIAAESLTGKGIFYRQLGIDTETEISKARELLTQYLLH